MAQKAAAKQITEGVIWKQILAFFFPILLGTFFQQMYNTVDTIIVGRFVSTEALAAVGTTGPLVNIFNGFFTGLGSGATVILAQFYGAGNKQGVRDTLHTGVALSLVLGLGVTVLGVAGAALATVLSQIVSAAMLLIVLLREKENPLRLSELRIQPKLLGRILAIGVPAGLQLVMFDLSNTLIQSGINSFGSTVMAAWTAYTKTDALTWMVSGAFGVSITTFVGQNYGAHKYDRVRQSVRVCLGMSIATVGVISTLMVLFRRFILGIYTTDAAVIEDGAYIISVIVPFAATFMPVEIFAGTMRGMGDSLRPTVIICLSVCVVRVAWIMTVVKKYHILLMLCICYPMTWVLCALVFIFNYWHSFRPRLEHV